VNSELLQPGLPPAPDRLLTTCFLAVLLHGIIILGVTFSPPAHDQGGHGAPGLEVILVGDQSPAVAANRDAAYLAQRNQQGAGNTQTRQRALIPRSSAAAADHPGVAGGDALAYRRVGQDSGDEAVVATTGRASRIRYLASAAASAPTAALPIRLERRPDLGMEANDDGIELRLRGKARRQLWIAADTRATDVAEYLDSWRRRVERIGTVNFPRIARLDRQSGTPIIEVTIAADGRLAGTTIRRSSGSPAIDDAAIRILQLAAPFAPFSRELSADHDEIRIAYQWEFLAGSARDSGVFYAPPTRAAGPAAPAPP
jgi:periplasmic protein TonB